jgi:hypothetical protein
MTMVRKTSLPLLAASALACASALTSTAFSQGTIAYFQPAQPIPVIFNPIVFPPVFYNFDVDGDGNADYQFNLADTFGVSVEPLGNNRQIALPAIPPDLGSDLDPLPAGFEIGSSLAPTYYWVGLNSPGFAGHSRISYQLDINGNVVYGGLFHGQDAYMGIEFLISGQPHYGWVHINNPGGQAGGFILDWAYETQPGAAILAGAVPEPSSWTLLAVGSFAVWFFRRR